MSRILFVGVILALALGVVHTMPFSYLYCLAREEAWLAAKTEKELVARLPVFRSEVEITPAVPGWGSHHKLREGDRMIRYLIFGKEPLDVVYARDGTVDAVYTSYE
ncbi:hypothetical protein ACFQY0_19415 [Haloferula chungangensis]|uniref:Uncharacterized protein n=1 Tax=Haloferula chungangensis TaxID=1048331 RepID=A0ABW2LCN4_9BACT